MTDELVVGVDVLVKSHCERWNVQWWVEDVEEEQGKLRRHRLEDRVPMCLREIVVGVDLPPRHVIRLNVKYPSCLSECGEVKVPSEDDDVEHDWDEKEVCWSANVNSDQGWKTTRGAYRWERQAGG